MDFHDIFLKAEELSFIEQFLRTSFLYFVLFAADRVMGFKQPGIITSYNFLMAAGISHIAASRMVIPDSRPIDAIAIIIVYTAIMLLVSYGYYKFPSFVSQTPTIIVKKGKIIKENLKKSKLTIDNMFSIIREKEAFNLEKVDYLVAEATGDYSVAINNNELPVTKSMMAIQTTPNELSQILIYEGKVDQKELKRNNLDMSWVYQQLGKYNISNIQNVYVGMLTPKKELYINQRED